LAGLEVKPDESHDLDDVTEKKEMGWHHEMLTVPFLNLYPVPQSTLDLSGIEAIPDSLLSFRPLFRTNQ
jgi:hypothetical protein